MLELRQARRGLLASVVALPLFASRAAFAEEEAAAPVRGSLPFIRRTLLTPPLQAKDVDIRALMLSTMLMGVAGFTAVGAASSPAAEGHEYH